MLRSAFTALSVSVCFLLVSCSSQNQLLPPPNQAVSGFEEVADRLREFISHQMESKDLPAFAIGVVDRDRTLWIESLGNVGSLEEPRSPNVATVYRVGSVSKLFTDIAVMRRVERGQLDLDVPVSDYLGVSLQLGSTGETPITLRHLMSHRAGLVREPPVGHYFDAENPTLRQTVESLSGQALLYPPGTRTKYSNGGIALVGYVLERTRGVSFPDFLRDDILEPLGMHDSAFALDSAIQESLAEAWMWSHEGRQFSAPRFQLGMVPAGSLYATIPDLCRFMQVLLNQGRGAAFELVAAESLAEMWTPQFSDSETGYGLGFHVGRLDEQRLISHGGAIYGFATQLSMLPDTGYGVVTVTNVDGANTVTSRVTDYALRLLVAHQQRVTLPSPTLTTPLEPQNRALEGDYKSGDERVSIYRQGNRLVLQDKGSRVPLGQQKERILTDGRLGYGREVLSSQSGIEIDGKAYELVSDLLPPPAREDWKGLIGSYGWDYNTLYILENRGRLWVLIEWFFEYALDELARDEYAFPSASLYQDEPLRFTRDGNDRATSVAVSGVVFPRRGDQPAGTTFKIQPVKPIAELRETALAALPPGESGKRTPDLLDLEDVVPGIRLDIRYATSNNFMGVPFYGQDRAFLQRPAAQALARVQSRLREQGYGLLVHDAYRPWYVTKMFWDATPEEMKIFVANPANGSRHNRGCAVDLTLYDLSTGETVEMVSGYDEFSERAYPRFPGGTSRQRWLRQLLRNAMEEEGFSVYEAEWWHFDYQDWSEYPILNQTFELLGKMATLLVVEGDHGIDFCGTPGREIAGGNSRGKKRIPVGRECGRQIRGVSSSASGHNAVGTPGQIFEGSLWTSRVEVGGGVNFRRSWA